MNIDKSETQEPKATNEESKAIKQILSDTVHQICSGQVVLNLAVAVKELVENSLDAGATLIEIKLHNQGIDSVEVSDNGCGVEEHNITVLTAKYHTSKLREFSDLLCVETFGFRGEALSSLCALCDMIISTRHSSTSVGTRVELDHNGIVKKKTHCARQVGTTVVINNLFSTLPVRKREFTRNIRKEFSRMCQVLQGYGLISKKVRIICWNINSKGSKNVVMSTHGSENYLENIHAIFGAKQVADLIELKSPFEEKITLESLLDVKETDSSFQITDDDILLLNSNQFYLEGWISSCEHGKGRGSKDRQFFFVNSRPCEPKNVSKVVNQIYHRYNLHQNPFVFLNVVMSRSNVDVNLTPDKRQLLINNEKILLLAIKKSLLKTFGNIPSSYKVQNTTLDTLYASQIENAVDSEDEVKVKPDPSKFISVFSQWKSTGDTGNINQPNTSFKRKKKTSPPEIQARTAKMKKIQQLLTNYKDTTQQLNDSSAINNSESEEEHGNSKILDTKEFKTESKEFDDLLANEEIRKEPNVVERITCKVISTPCIKPYELKIVPVHVDEEHKPASKKINMHVDKDDDKICVVGDRNTSKDKIEVRKTEKRIILDSTDEESDGSADICHEIKISIDEIRKALNIERESQVKEIEENLNRLKFKSRIDPSQNQFAEKELQLEITQDMFSKMEIIGQFNLGFIIVRLDADLFIIDQHASDEKFNFEQLQNTTVLQYQQLAVPQTLEMTLDCEMVLIDNLSIFEKNGFKFHIDENAPLTRRIKLLGKPFSKNWEFGKDDIDELIFMLRDAPNGTICRPSRIRAMFASRACRKSVMIGTALSESTMRMLVNHMGEIDHPWNCPHGRPTMRHLINVDLLPESDTDECSESECEAENHEVK